MTTFPRLILCCLLTTMLAATAMAQVQQPPIGGFQGLGGHHGGHMGAGAGYYGGYGAPSGAAATHLPHLGRTAFSITGAVEGLGYRGSYVSAATTVPVGGIDPLHGWWLIDARVNVSQQGMPFTNVGLVRRAHFRPMNADIGIGIYHDMDADEYDTFGHTFQQVGISANVWTPRFDININGYVPVGDTNHSLGYRDTCFFQNYLVLEHGIDAALEGFDINFVFRPDWWAQKSGAFTVGVYAYRSDGQPYLGFTDDQFAVAPGGTTPVDTPQSVSNTNIAPFAGFRGGLSWQPKPGMFVSLGVTADDQFDPSGIFQVEFIRGRSRGLSPSGRDLDPMVRNAHIVRFHRDPVLASDPETGELYRFVHVNNAAPDGGNGTFERPFNELSDADGTLPPIVVDIPQDGGRVIQREIPRSRPNDIIFVWEGLSRDLNGNLDNPTPAMFDDPAVVATLTDPSDDLPGDLTGYDTGIALLPGQQLLGDGVQHILPTNEFGNFILCNDQDGLTPYISNGIHFPTPTSGTQPDRAAVTLADNTTVRGFNIINSEIGILAPDPTPTLNNNDGITGDITLERINIFVNNQFDVNDLVRNAGTAADPDLATIRVPLKYGISILDSTADFAINNVNIKGQDVILPNEIFDDGTGALTRVVTFTPEGNLVAALNVERGAPDIMFNGTIDNEFTLLQEVILDDGDDTTIDPILQVELDTLSAGGRAVRIVDTTGGNIFIDGLINNVLGQGIMIDNADDTTITIDSMVMIDQSTTPSVSIMNSDDSNIAFTNQVLITDPQVAGVWLTDNTDTEITFFDLQVTTPTNQDDRDMGNVLTNTPVTGFLAQRNSGGMINVTGKSLLNIVGGPALSLAGVDGDETPVNLNFTELRSVDSADGGINLANISGVVRSGRTTVIDSASTGIVATSNDGAPLLVDFGQATITPTPDTDPNGAGFQGPGVFLQNNDSATFSFDQLTILTGSGDPADTTNNGGSAFVALDGGTINFNSVPDLTARGGAVLHLRDVTGTFQNAPGLVFDDLTTIQRNGAGIIIDGVTNDVLITNAFIPNDRLDAGGAADFAAGNAINILNTAATGARVTIDSATISDVRGDGIDITNSLATIRNVLVNNPNFSGTRNGINVVSSVDMFGLAGPQTHVVIEDNNVAAINGSGIDVRTQGTGTLAVDVSGNTASSDFNAAIIIDGTAGGTLVVTDLADNVTLDRSVDGTGLGGILVHEVTFDSDLVTAGLQQVAGGDTLIGNQFSGRAEGIGLALQDVEGELHFKSLHINNGVGTPPFNGTGLLVTNPDTTFNLIIGTGAIDTNTGAAMQIESTNLDVNLSLVVSSNASNSGSGPAIRLDDVTGELVIDRTSITDAGTGIHVSNSTGGFIADFGDVSISGTGTQGDGVVLNNNATALIEFQGLDIQTDAGNGFYVRDGGTVNFSGESPMVVANNGTAVDIDALTIGQTDGVEGWTFGSISLNTAAGATGGSAVRLNNIVNDFTVTGNTNINSNGEAGIFITGGDTAIQFAQVNSTNRLAVGIQIEDINGTVRIASANIDNANTVAGNAINIIDTFANGNSGNVAILGGLITDAENDGVHIENSIATIANVSIRSPNATEKHDGISVVTNGVNDAIVLLDSNTVFQDDGDVGIRLLANGTGTLNATVTDNLLRGNEMLDPLIDNIASIHATSASGTLFLNAVENHDGDGTTPTNPIRLENLGGTIDVTQANAGALSALNNNVDVEIDGVINFNAGTPPEPPPVPSN